MELASVDPIEVALLINRQSDLIFQLLEGRCLLQERLFQLLTSLRPLTNDLADLLITGSITLCSREVATPLPVLL